MSLGILYGIGVGPGDPELITLKGARVLAACEHVFVPKSRAASESMALSIAQPHLPACAQVHELVFPMTSDPAVLERNWTDAARQVAEVLLEGRDACFLTLGDPLLYSTYIHLVRRLRAVLPEAQIVTVPGVTSVSAAAALTNFPMAEGKEPVSIVPTADDLDGVRRAFAAGGTVVLMKVGSRLQQVLDVLEEMGALDSAVFVARAGQDGQRVETDLRRLRTEGAEAGYLSIILARGRTGGEP